MGEEAANDSVDFAGLIELIQGGDIRGEEELYRVFARGFRYLLARRIPGQDVEDKLHDTFIALAQAVRRGSPKNPEALPAFAYRILRRQIANTYRGRKICMEPETAIVEIADCALNGLDMVLLREQRQRLECALAALTPEERELIVRLYISAESPKQIQGDMRLTEARFYSVKTRACKKLLALIRKPEQRSGQPRSVNRDRLAV